MCHILRQNSPHASQPHTHEVHDQLAYPDAEDEVLHEVGDEGERDAHQGDHEVTDSQGQQEQVGDRPHAPVPHKDSDDEAVSQDAEEEDEAVEDNPDRLVDVWGSGTNMQTCPCHSSSCEPFRVTQTISSPCHVDIFRIYFHPLSKHSSNIHELVTHIQH